MIKTLQAIVILFILIVILAFNIVMTNIAQRIDMPEGSEGFISNGKFVPYRNDMQRCGDK